MGAQRGDHFLSRPLKIGLVKKGNAGWVGGQEYIKNIALAAKAASAAQGFSVDVCMLVPEGEDASTVSRFARPVAVPSDMPPVRLGRLRAWLAGTKDDRPFDSIVRKEGFDFVYPVDALSASVPSRRAAWIPDLQHRIMPEYCTAQELSEREAWIASMRASARTLVFSSEASREDFRAAYGERGHALEVLRFRISLPEALRTGDMHETVQRYSLPPIFFLVSNQFWQHKNHMVLIEAMALAKREVPDLVVAMTGALVDYRNPAYAGSVLQRIDEFGLGGIELRGSQEFDDAEHTIQRSANLVTDVGKEAELRLADLLGGMTRLGELPLRRLTAFDLAHQFVLVVEEVANQSREDAELMRRVQHGSEWLRTLLLERLGDAIEWPTHEAVETVDQREECEEREEREQGECAASRALDLREQR